jgi:hypothetical protein
MKRVNFLLSILLISSSSFAQTRQVFEKSVYDAELDQFETYAIGDMTNISGETFVTENQLLSSMVENAIEYEMDTYNYNMEKENPDMLINYMVFDQKYSDEVGYMPGFRLDEDFGMDDNILKDIKDGSMMVSMVRTKDGKAVWSGYVIDGIDPEASLREQQKDARQAISAAMEVFMAHVNFEDITSTLRD